MGKANGPGNFRNFQHSRANKTKEYKTKPTTTEASAKRTISTVDMMMKATSKNQIYEKSLDVGSSGTK